MKRVIDSGKIYITIDELFVKNYLIIYILNRKECVSRLIKKFNDQLETGEDSYKKFFDCKWFFPIYINYQYFTVRPCFFV